MESLMALSRCQTIYHDDGGEESTRFLQVIGPEVRALGARGAGAPARAARRLASEVRQGRTVGLATHGSPLFFGSLGRHCLREFAAAGLPCEVFSSVSPLGAGLSQEQWEMGYDFRAATATSHAELLRPSWSVMAESLLVVYFDAEVLTLSQARRVERSLGRFYPARHRALLCRDRPGATRRPISIGELHRHHRLIDRRCLLLLAPPGKSPAFPIDDHAAAPKPFPPRGKAPRPPRADFLGRDRRRLDYLDVDCSVGEPLVALTHSDVFRSEFPRLNGPAERAAAGSPRADISEGAAMLFGPDWEAGISRLRRGLASPPKYFWPAGVISAVDRLPVDRSREFLERLKAPGAGDDAATWALRGLALIKGNLPEAGLQALGEAVRRDDAGWIRTLRATVLRRLKGFWDAWKDLEACTSGTIPWLFYLEQALSLKMAGYFEEAGLAVSRSMALGGDRPMLLALRGRILLLAGRPEAAAAAFSRALAAEPRQWLFRLQRAWAWAQAGRSAACLKDLERIRELEGDLPAVKFERAWILSRVGRREEAARVLEEIDPTARERHLADFNRGLIEFQGRRYGSADRIFRELAGSDPRASDCFSKEARAYSLLSRVLDWRDRARPSPRAQPLVLCGLGANFPEQVTVEGLHELAKADVIYHNFPDDLLFSRFLNFLSPEIHPLQLDARKSIERMVLDVRKGRRTAFATRAHPLMYGKPAHIMKRRRGDLPHGLEVLSAISSFDLIPVISRIALKYPIGGVQVLDDSVLLRGAPGLNLRLPLVFFFNSTLDPGEFDRICDFLLTLYPPRHPCIFSASPQEFVELPLSKLRRHPGGSTAREAVCVSPYFGGSRTA